jgi:hypothetical protein
MTLKSMQHIPLTSAYLCADCHCVGNCASHCPACASRALIGLAGVLDREVNEETAAATPISFARQAGARIEGVALAA